jgi:hypothetical protein
LATNDGWPRALQACKGNGSRMRLDEDKKGSFKAKEEVCGFWITFVIDYVESRACRNE